MRDALLALHFQNDICHRDGLIPFSLDRSTSAAANFLSAGKRALDEARRAGWTIAHIHIAFAPDYSDLLRNCRLFMGLATQFSVEHTVRDAADIGYHVLLLADCCASGDMEAHGATLRTMPLLADVIESREALSD